MSPDDGNIGLRGVGNEPARNLFPQPNPGRQRHRQVADDAALAADLLDVGEADADTIDDFDGLAVRGEDGSGRDGFDYFGHDDPLRAAVCHIPDNTQLAFLQPSLPEYSVRKTYRRDNGATSCHTLDIVFVQCNIRFFSGLGVVWDQQEIPSMTDLPFLPS